MAAAGGGSILGGGTQSMGAAAAAGDAFVSARFMPKKKLERLEERRVVSRHFELIFFKWEEHYICIKMALLDKRGININL